MSKLFTPLSLGTIELVHRLVSLPAARDPFEPHVLDATAGGLIILAPQRITSEDASAWRRTTDGVHARGGLVVAQLPSPASSYASPSSLDEADIAAVLDHYRRTSAMARDAGVDAVELDATTESLPARFLFDGTNTRTDDYGGSIDNRITLLAQAVEVISEVFTAGRVGVRLSPWLVTDDSDPSQLFTRVLESLAEQEIAYVHLADEDAAGVNPEVCALAQRYRAAFPAVLLFSGPYTLAIAERAVDSRLADAVGLHESAAHPDFIALAVAAAEAARH
jgi:N-ethylmaleimide reductase